jgi:hypothetical protein
VWAADGRVAPKHRSLANAAAGTTVALATAALLREDARFPHGAIAMPQVNGEFDVKRTPEGGLELGGGAIAGHFRFDKQFHGPLDATGVVHMLAVGTEVDGSAAYVAIERINGTLDGRSGAFFTQHNGTLDRGSPSLSVTVVPDSGTGELAGLRGRMVIDIVDGKHFYTFDYEIVER